MGILTLLKNEYVLFSISVLGFMLYKKVIKGEDKKQITSDTLVVSAILALNIFIMLSKEDISGNAFRVSGNF
jgi:hypothetical protein